MTFLISLIYCGNGKESESMRERARDTDLEQERESASLCVHVCERWLSVVLSFIVKHHHLLIVFSERWAGLCSLVRAFEVAVNFTTLTLTHLTRKSKVHTTKRTHCPLCLILTRATV